MEIIPLASESLGNRGLSLFVSTEDQNILIDPSVSLGPHRYGYPPHIHEIATSRLSRHYIMKFAEKASIIIQTHYHADHYSLGIDRPYEFTNKHISDRLYSSPEKKILAKDQNNNINYSQKKRAYWLWRRKKVPIYSADGNTFVFGRTRIVFSNALPHGEVGSKQGWVVAVHISDSYESVLITSDVSGPGSDLALNFIQNNKADITIIDGPSSYHPQKEPESIKEAFKRLLFLNDSSSVKIDHHLLRDANWIQLLNQYGINTLKITLSSLLGLPPMCLENQRAQLYEKFPMDPSFHFKFNSNDPIIMEMIHEISMKFPYRYKLDLSLSRIARKKNVNS